jgi:signal transduction histidine kinase
MPTAWLTKRRGPGIRRRIVGTLLFTSACTLLVAAVALLGPLEHVLRQAALDTLRRDLNTRELAGFKQMNLAAVSFAYTRPSARGLTPNEYREELRLRQAGAEARDALLRQESAVATRTGASDVNLIGYPDGRGNGQLVARPSDGIGARTGSLDDVSEAFRERRRVVSFATSDGVDVARVAVPLTITNRTQTAVWHQRYVLAVRKPINEISGAVAAVRSAFFVAAGAGFALALLLGVPLSATLTRRLRRLRGAVLEVGRLGPVVRLPIDKRRDEVGDLTRAFAVMQHRLEQQEEARRVFVATASHELRTPIASLDGMLELLEDDLAQTEPNLEESSQLLERARAQTRRLAGLAADLLELSRLDAEIELRSEPLELVELCRAVVAEFDARLTERGIRYRIESPAGDAWVLGDPGALARILRILIDNAVRVSPAGSAIVLVVHDDSSPTVCVRDSGPGVPPEERKLIFERFQRGRATFSQAGFGLGLAIGRELATRMSGELVLDEVPSGGASFTLRLPAADPSGSHSVLRA